MRLIISLDVSGVGPSLNSLARESKEDVTPLILRFLSVTKLTSAVYEKKREDYPEQILDLEQSIASQHRSISLKKEPKKRYACLDRISGVFYYTPFEQGALAHNLDSLWQGSCNVISHSWMYRKVKSFDFRVPVSYEITDSHLPHPMIVGDNHPDGQDIQKIKNTFERHGYIEVIDTQFDVNLKTEKEGVEAIISYFKDCGETYSVLIESSMLFNRSVTGHACAFVRRGDLCAWYDPNYGEIVFEQFKDFVDWFSEEVMEGTQMFILPEAFEKTRAKKNNNKMFLSDLYPVPVFSDEEKELNQLSKAMVEKRMRGFEVRQQTEVEMVSGYSFYVYTPGKDFVPLLEIEDISFM